jgi:hypothetical protein
MPLKSIRGTLAQLVEQRTFNPLVAGSNPARPTKIPSEINDSGRVVDFFSSKSIKVSIYILFGVAFRRLISGWTSFLNDSDALSLQHPPHTHLCHLHICIRC